MRIIKYKDLEPSFFEPDLSTDEQSVAKIIKKVREKGDEALQNYTLEFDGVWCDLALPEKDIEEACETLSEEEFSALRTAAVNIEKFARAQLSQFSDLEIETRPGVHVGHRVIPVQRAGVYVPGGRFPLVSTLLMCAIPARVAGVSEIAVVSPPTFEGSIHPYILAACRIAGVKEVYRAGGAQAIAALAYGTETVSPVDVIVGPGNRYVAAAKKMVYGKVGIDFIAGPTEVLIIADDSASPAVVAADLLAQAEHDVCAVPVLVTESEKLAHEVKNEVESQLQALETRETAGKSMEANGRIVITPSWKESVKLANRKAPEHLELQVENPDQYIEKLHSYGTLFIGENAAEALGDYTAGLNHTLPTSGCARYTSGLSIKNFIKTPTTLRVTDEGLGHIGAAAITLGQMEGLSAHAASVKKRIRENSGRIET